MNLYISDTHFCHGNIIRLCNRPFSSVEDMNEALIGNWNRKANNGDTVYMLGDFAFKCGVEKAVSILDRLKGKKVLIEGNHDGRYIQSPEFCSRFENIAQMLQISDNGQRLFLCHYPMAEWPGYFGRTLHLYGHIHNNTENPAYGIMSNLSGAYNAGVDITGFEPVTLEELIQRNREFRQKQVCRANMESKI